MQQTEKLTSTDKKILIATGVLTALTVGLAVATLIVSKDGFTITKNIDTIKAISPKNEPNAVQEIVQETVKNGSTRNSPIEHFMKMRDGYNMSLEKRKPLGEV